MINFQILKTFVTVAEQKNFRKAGEVLQYSQPTISVHIKTLEDTLGEILLNRKVKGVELTENGELFLQYARKVLFEWDEIKNVMKCSDTISGKIRMGCPESIAISLINSTVKEFCNKWKDIFIQIKTESFPQMIELLDDNKLDFIYILNKELNYDQWKKIFQKEEKIVFVCDVKNKWSNKASLSWDDIEKMEFVLADSRHTTNYVHELLMVLQSKGIRCNIVLETSNTSSIKEMLIGNELVSFLPYFVVKNEIQEGTLVVLDINDIDISMWHQIFIEKRKWLSPACTAFIEAIIKNME